MLAEDEIEEEVDMISAEEEVTEIVLTEFKVVGEETLVPALQAVAGAPTHLNISREPTRMQGQLSSEEVAAAMFTKILIRIIKIVITIKVNNKIMMVVTADGATEVNKITTVDEETEVVVADAVVVVGETAINLTSTSIIQSHT